MIGNNKKGGAVMPNIKSAKKRVLLAEKRNLRNKAYKYSLRTLIKKADAAIEGKADDRAEVVKAAMVKIDKAAAKGIIHKNNAAHKKSSLAVKLNASNA